VSAGVLAVEGNALYRAGGTDVPVTDGGTGASSASDARTNLGLAIGTDVQAYDADLAAFAGLASTGLVARTGSGTVAARTITGTTDEIDVANGDGVSGNPTLSLPSTILVGGLKPAANGTTALRLYHANGSTPLLTCDTTNGGVGIGNITPTSSCVLTVTGASGQSVSFTKTPGNTGSGLNTAFVFSEIGSITADNAFWNGLQYGGHLVTESGGFVFPRMTYYSESTAVADPTDYRWIIQCGNTTNTAQNLVFQAKATSAQTAETQGAVRFSTNLTDALFVGRNGNIGIGGTTSFGTNATRVIGMSNAGVAPASSPANIVQIYCEDVSSSARLKIRDEAGNIYTISKQTALTAALTTITHTAPGTPDYAVQDLTNSGGFGFATKDEGNTVLSVIARLQTRVNELETKLQAIGLLT
jgi:hypothetical protein